MFRGNEYCTSLNRQTDRENILPRHLWVSLRSPQWLRPAFSEGCKQFWRLGVHQWLPRRPEVRRRLVCERSCAGEVRSLLAWSSEAVQQTVFSQFTQIMWKMSTLFWVTRRPQKCLSSAEGQNFKPFKNTNWHLYHESVSPICFNVVPEASLLMQYYSSFSR